MIALAVRRVGCTGRSYARGMATVRGNKGATRAWRAMLRRVGRVHVQEIPAEPRQVAGARRFVRRVLRGHARCDDAMIVVSELATNAIQHGSSRPQDVIRVLVATLPHGNVYLSVTDAGVPGHAPRVPATRGVATSGRGLEIVTALARRWRVARRHGGGHSVAVVLGGDLATPDIDREPEPDAALAGCERRMLGPPR